MIYCFGDSITDGRPGVTYIKYLAGKSQCINCGLGGDTVIGVTKRLKDMPDHTLGAGDYVVLGIGTNDILFPHFYGCTASWQDVAKRHEESGSVPCKDIDEFREKYRQLIACCRERTANIIVFGIPLLETTENQLDASCEKYNREIEAICREARITYIDFRNWQIEQKKRLHNEGSFFLTSNNRTHRSVKTDAFFTTYLPFESKISRKRGLAMTIDGCHLNAFSARGLAGLINPYLNTNQNQSGQ